MSPPAAISASTRPISLGPDALEASEWLLTNGLGGFAMGTALGIPTRRYHAWLVAALTPPVGRAVALHSVAETLVLEADHAHPEQRLDFASYNFRGARRHPAGWQLLTSFEKDVTCRWHYKWGPISFSRELALLRDQNAAVVRYRVNAESRRARLELRPLIALRDFHALLRADDAAPYTFSVTAETGGLRVARDLDVAAAMGLACRGARETVAPQWWRNFEYDHDRLRGQDFIEDLFSPGLLCHPVDPRPGEHIIELLAWAQPARASDSSAPPRAALIADARPRGDLDADLHDERWRLIDLAKAATQRLGLASAPALAETDRPIVEALVRAADQFIVGREPLAAPAPAPAPAPAAASDAPLDTSIIAGYPWFSDWGRDAMISLPGLLLVPGRFYEAQRLLATFARHARNGLVPNCFSDQTGHAEYNTVDASLWFLHAACQYLRASGDRRGFDGPIRQACLQIVDAYRAGSDFHIRLDPADGLITAGDPSTQLTWMDARRDGVVFTPRHGKPVEINALWCSGLIQLAHAIDPDQPRTARELRQLADLASRSFRDRFWNDSAGCLYDVLTPDDSSPSGWLADPRIRPNQIFAVSLPHSPLDLGQQAAVLDTVRARLLTPLGLRTLDPADPGYKPRYQGTLFERDAAYHNGTVWPWLIGPYAEAVLRVGGFSGQARAEARAALQGLLDEFDTRSIGTLPEIYDAEGDESRPRSPQGCMAQAWSVAEVLRALVLVHSTAPKD